MREDVGCVVFSFDVVRFQMAYRPPTQSRYAPMTEAPPGARSSHTRAPPEDDWITPVPRKRSNFGAAVTGTPVPKPVEKKLGEEDFPSLGAGTTTLPKKTWGSTESMAERVKKQMQEEEEKRILEEEDKARKEADNQKKSYSDSGGIQFITHQSVVRRFREEEQSQYDAGYDYSHEYDQQNDLECDGYGNSHGYDYAEDAEPHTPEYPYEEGENDWN
jgi:hypothetical protein